MLPRLGSRTQTVLLLLLGAGVTAGVGWACLSFPFAAGLERLSYDLPFALQSHVATPEICLVTMDEKAAGALGQPLDDPWDRELHARLVRSLTAAGARAVLFDLSFDAPSKDPAVDEDFAAAMKENGHVFIGATFLSGSSREVVEEQIIPPTPVLRKAAAGWGLLILRPIDPDFGVRRIFPGTDEVPSVTWRLARHLGAPLAETPDANAEARWLNHYAPPGRFARAGFQQALQPADLPPRFFQDRIVIVGGHGSMGNLNQQRDEFITPYTRWGEPFAAGMEIHATTVLNLLRRDWLTRVSRPKEMQLILFLGAGIAVLLSAVCAFCPFRMGFAAGVVIVLVMGVICWSVWQQRLWFNWLVLAGIQTPVALFWSLSSRYFLEAKQQKIIRRAFGLYLSPEMAREIALARYDLKPGGRLMETTMIFTDLEGFTKLSARLSDPRQISDMLITYFNNTTKHVLDHRGTILKYIGDAVFAAWGAPLQQKDHALNAVRAAWGMHQYGKLNVHGLQLVTRIGVHTGTVLAGNLGSTFRFDYTLIGDPVNVTSRLEGLNKYLGTQVLLSDETWKKVSDHFVGRLLGKFRVSGRKEPVIVHELLGPVVITLIQETIKTFAEALAAFQAGELGPARVLFEQTRALHEAVDGPTEFYLQQIKQLELTGLPEQWDGVISLDK